MAKGEQPEKAGFRERLKQIGMVFRFTAKQDRLFIPLLIGVVLLVGGLTTLLFSLWGWVWIPVGVMLAVLGVMIVLNLRANRVMMAQAEQQPGAAAAIMENMRGDWRVTPAVQATTQNDFVHRVVARAGVILLAEGHPSRIRGLLSQEKKRLGKVVGDTPIYDFTIGHDEDQVPLRKLRSTLVRLPRNITGKQVNALDTRLSALSARPQMPKGPVPKSMRPPKGAFKATRGR